MTVQTQRKLTFAQLARLEPGLRALLREARSYHRGAPRNFCANAVWYGYPRGPGPCGGGLKDRMQRLVGFHRRDGDEVLRTSAAYDVAYDTIFRALPDCRECGCFRLSDLWC